MARVRQMSAAQRRHAAARRRDGALDRLSTVTAGIAVGTIAAVGVFGAYVAKALPGHHATTTGSTSTAGNTGASTGSSSAGAANSLNPPSSQPQSAPLPAPVTSGSS